MKLVWTAAGAGLIAAGIYAYRLQQAAENMEINSTIRLHKIALDGLHIAVSTTIKNPSSQSVSIRFPFVKLSMGNRVIGSSQVSNKVIEIKKHGTAVIEDIMIHIPVAQLLPLGINLFNHFINGTADLNMNIECKSAVKTPISWIKFNYSEDIVLKRSTT
jgi:hypothetical protein